MGTKAKMTISHAVSILNREKPVFLEGLSPAQVQMVVAKAGVRRYAANAVITNEAAGANHLFLLLEGAGRGYALTSRGEKIGLGWYLDGRVTAVVGGNFQATAQRGSRPTEPRRRCSSSSSTFTTAPSISKSSSPRRRSHATHCATTWSQHVRSSGRARSSTARRLLWQIGYSDNRLKLLIPTSGTQNVREVFGELLVPVLKDLPLVDEVSLRRSPSSDSSAAAAAGSRDGTRRSRCSTRSSAMACEAHLDGFFPDRQDAGFARALESHGAT